MIVIQVVEVAQTHENQFDGSVFIPFANHLLSEGEWEESLKYYQKAGREDLGIQVLNHLSDDYIELQDFDSVSYCHFLISNLYISMVFIY